MFCLQTNEKETVKAISDAFSPSERHNQYTETIRHNNRKERSSESKVWVKQNEVKDEQIERLFQRPELIKKFSDGNSSYLKITKLQCSNLKKGNKTITWLC